MLALEDDKMELQGELRNSIATPMCDVGLPLWDPQGDGTFEVREIVVGGSAWYESKAHPKKMLPLVGDRIRMINSRLLSSAALIPQLLNGPEGTVLEMLVDKHDGSGIFTVNLIRRVKFEQVDTPEPADTLLTPVAAVAR